MGEQTGGRNTQATFGRSDQPRGRTLRIEGEIDMAVGPQFGEELAALIEEAHSPAFVDLSGVTFMDTTGVHALLDATHAGLAAGHPLVLVAASRSSRRILEVAGVQGEVEFSDE
jgi:anti-anti-sigma factor